MKNKLLSFILCIAVTLCSLTGVQAKDIGSKSSDTNDTSETLNKIVAENVLEAKTLAQDLTEVSPMPSASAPVSQPPASEAPAVQPKIKISTLEGKTVSSTAPYYYTNVSQMMDEEYSFYNVDVSAGYPKAAVVPVKVKAKGILLLSAVKYPKTSITMKYIYSDAACTKKIAVSNSIAYLPKAATYYIKIDKSQISQTEDNRFAIVLGHVSGENRVIKNKSDVIASSAGTSSPVYFKVTVKKTTKLTLGVYSDLKGTAALCNGKKVPITHETSISKNGGVHVYVVSKGSYYFKVKCSKGLFSVTADLATVSNGSGTSKAKAGTLKINGSAKNILLYTAAPSSRGYYLKFYNPKKQKINMYVTSSFSSGKVKLDFIDTKHTDFGKAASITSGVNQKRVYRTFIGKNSDKVKTLPKGTYYIRIQKLDKKTSGIIQVNIKNK